MSFRNATITVILALLLGGMTIIFWPRHDHQTNTGAHAPITSTREVVLQDISTDPLVYQKNAVFALWQDTQLTSTFLPDFRAQQVVSFSPTGKFAIAVVSGQVQFIRVSTGMVLRDFTWEKDRIVQDVAWSPNEETVLISSDRQMADGGPIAHSNHLDLWTLNSHQQVQLNALPPNEQPFNLMSVNNDGSRMVCGWTSEQGMHLFHCATNAAPIPIVLPDGVISTGSTSAYEMLSAISHDKLLVASQHKVFVLQLSSDTFVQLGSDSQTHIQVSPVTPDGANALAVVGGQHSTDMVLRYSFVDGRDTTIMPVYTDYDGLYLSHWISNDRFLLYESNDHQFKAIDTQDTRGALLNVVMPVSGIDWSLVGLGE